MTTARPTNAARYKRDRDAIAAAYREGLSIPDLAQRFGYKTPTDMTARLSKLRHQHGYDLPLRRKSAPSKFSGFCVDCGEPTKGKRCRYHHLKFASGIAAEKRMGWR